jgi:hypothetical protein
MGLLDSYGPRDFADRGGMLGRLLSLRPDLAQDQQGDDQLAQDQIVQASTPKPNDVSAFSPISSAIGDFYRQSIQKPGRDIAGYVNDAINDPAYFAHAIGPSLGGLGPIASELPGAVKGALGVAGILGQAARGVTKTEEPASESQLGDKPASTPVGRRGDELNVISGTNQPVTIGGRKYIGHAADQMQARGVPPSAVEDAIQNGMARPGNKPGRTLHIGVDGVKVVTDSDGQVITVIPGKRR